MIRSAVLNSWGLGCDVFMAPTHDKSQPVPSLKSDSASAI